MPVAANGKRGGLVVRSGIERGEHLSPWRGSLSAALLALAAAMSAHAGTQSVATPVRAEDIRIAECLDLVTRNAGRESEHCPAFLVEQVAQGERMCSEAGGTLRAESPANVWALDVNGDGKRELTFEYAGNVTCEDAWSLFECGSLGCPKVLYEERNGAWRAIAEISVDAMESLEVLPPATGQTYRNLRVGCAGETPCPEYWQYEWTGERYECKRVDVRGFHVDFAHSVHGLYSLAGETTLLATPEPGANVIGHYDASTEVEIIGTAEGADYYYISPCRACESGFVPKAAVRIP
jgi:hypothetical protein